MANPENTANDQASAPTNVPQTNARAQFEAERMTRRAALRKFGFGAGMAALLALSTDDLARMAAAKLKQQAGDNQVANQVANEFKNAGLAFATGSSPIREGCKHPQVPGSCGACADASTCISCCRTACSGDTQCLHDCQVGCNGGAGIPSPIPANPCEEDQTLGSYCNTHPANTCQNCCSDYCSSCSDPEACRNGCDSQCTSAP